MMAKIDEKFEALRQETSAPVMAGPSSRPDEQILALHDRLQQPNPYDAIRREGGLAHLHLKSPSNFPSIHPTQTTQTATPLPKISKNISAQRPNATDPLLQVALLLIWGGPS